jgi:hypothetical protein
MFHSGQKILWSVTDLRIIMDEMNYEFNREVNQKWWRMIHQMRCFLMFL